MRAVSEHWHSTDSVLYLERLCDEQRDQIQYLRAELDKIQEYKRLESFGELGETKNPRDYKSISGHEPWNMLKARIERQQREKELKKNVDETPASPD